LRARYYDPEIGRFITKDIFPGFAHKPWTLNRYAYVYNNPVNFDDPSGNWAIIDDVIVGGIGAIGGLVGQYASDVIGDVVDGKTGFDVLKPTSNWKVYAVSAAGGAITAEACLYLGPVGAPVAVGVISGATSIGRDYAVGEQPDFKNALVNVGISAATAGLLKQFPKVPGRWPNFATKAFWAGKHTQNILLRQAVHTGINIDKELISNSYNLFLEIQGYNLIPTDK